MKRDLTTLLEKEYDLLVVGGGIYGACLVWEATLRGLSVALLEKSDFGSATSANSLKIIHGGIRYLQHADLQRARESIVERKILMRLAPHLVHPLPVLIPTYGHGWKGKEVFALGLLLNDLLSIDRNWFADPQKHIPRGRTISRQECLELVPGINSKGLTGGAIFYDGQVYNSERLLLSFLHSASNLGAALVNYVEVINLLQEENDNRVTGVVARDVLTGHHFQVRARMVANTTGPWINPKSSLVNSRKASSQADLRFAKAFNLVTRPLFDTYAVGVSDLTQYQDRDAIVDKGNRFLFIAPWRNRSMIGTEYLPYDGSPDDFEITELEIQQFLNRINEIYPLADLGRDDVFLVQGGLVPMDGIDSETGSVQLKKHHWIYDHQKEGIRGLISIVGVKYTTARNVAVKAVDKILQILGREPVPSTSAVTRLHDGKIEDFEAFLAAKVKESSGRLSKVSVFQLVHNYGSAYPEVLRYLDANSNQKQEVYRVLRAEILYGVHEEMVQKLADIVFRRTGLGTIGHPGEMNLRFCAEVLRTELGWDQVRMNQEIEEVNQILRKPQITKV